MLALFLLPLVATVPVAGDDVANSSSTSLSNESTKVSLGPLAQITSWSYSSGTFHIVIYAKAAVPVTISTPPGESDSGTMRYIDRDLSKGKNEFEVEASAGVGRPTLVFSTPSLRQENEAKYIRAPSTGIFPSGPYDASDARDVGLGSAGGVAVAHLWIAVRARLGSTDRAERVA